jgi:hypothetical protein
MRRGGVSLGIDSDRPDAQPSGRAEDPAGDFAAIGDKKRADHGRAGR